MAYPIDTERYQRQLALAEIGRAGQERLAAARVLVVGAGGLGCPVLQYLAAAGVGYIGVVDGDVVGLSNLHRQLLYNTADIGQLKVKAAVQALARINPSVMVKTYPFYLHNVLALELLPKYDIIVDCTDNFPTRYLLNDACALLQKPLVMAALGTWQGQLAVLHAGSGHTQGINYRDLYPTPPEEHEVPNCAQAGVMGVLPGLMGTLQAAEVIKWITGVGKLQNAGMLVWDLKTLDSYTVSVAPAAISSGPADRQAFLLTNYSWYCGARDVAEVSSRDLPRLLAAGAVFIDVRELTETPDLPVAHRRMPLSQLRCQPAQVDGAEVVLVCHQGVRSIEAARILGRHAPAAQKIYSLKGGIMALAAAL